jgi:hypothetical protein
MSLIGWLALAALGIGSVVLFTTILEWAEEIILGIAGIAVGCLYVTRQAIGAVLRVITRTKSRGWVLSGTRELSERELPEELRGYPLNVEREAHRYTA